MEKENKELCSRCRGFCCIKSGCDYSAFDFDDLRSNALYNKLMEGNISIVSFLRFKKSSNGVEYVEPFLYLRARNTGREVVDLLSMKTRCSLLTENGCKYDASNRPSGGLNLIPDKNGCYPLEDPFKIVDTWKSYQKVLSKIVKRITGNNVDKQLEIDVGNLFYDVLNDRYDNVTEREKHEIGILVRKLAYIYPYKLQEAVDKTDKFVLKKK